MRWIFLSPHFDDAVLSCGGLIWKQTQKGVPVEIWTICAGDAPPGPLSRLARDCHLQWGIESAKGLVAARRAENNVAASLVGAEIVDFSIPDCIYRRSLTGEALYPEEVFVPIHPSELDLDADIAAALTSELLPGDRIVSPLAIGGHPDHTLTRTAAELLNLPILYYADLPYLINHPESLVPATTGLEDTIHPISKRGLSIWQKSIAAYTSQIRLLFETQEKMEAAIHRYWEIQRGICLWFNPPGKQKDGCA
jgi:LmbE family N-acetylglucosaminyl deacetylase